MKSHIIPWALLLVSLLPVTSLAKNIRITITNPSDHERKEVVEIPLQTIREKMGERAFVVTDAKKNEVVSQTTHDGLLLIEAQVPAGGKQKFTIRQGTPKSYEPAVFVKMYAQRLDDIAWENDHIAFRTYGPTLQNTGERAFGIDVWTKNTSALVVEQRYEMELNPAHKREVYELWKKDPAAADKLVEKYSYHYDHGNGMDCYKVGPTLGCGTPALIGTDGELIYPWGYKTYQILEEGPLRVQFSTTYKPRKNGLLGTTTEERTITLDKHSRLNRLSVSYQGLEQPTRIAGGIIIHKEDTLSYHIDTTLGYLSYSDPTDNVNAGNGRIFVGLVASQTSVQLELRPFTKSESRKARGGDYGHLLALHAATPAVPTASYYAGATWSKEQIHSQEEWNAYLAQFARDLRQPLQVEIK
ncbi:MAG: DUF4861 domain-containing protein [Bacteroidaceae bacterium]|nr:DUF4861 domain-containing protein [Bacteroidaceae bacterium]